MKTTKIKNILREKIQAFFYFIISKSYFVWRKIKKKWKKLTWKQKKIMAIIIILLIPIAIVAWNVPAWYKEYVFRTRWPSDQKDLKPAPAGDISQNINQACGQRRKAAGNLYAAIDIPKAIENSSADKIILTGKENDQAVSSSGAEPMETPAIVINASGKDVALFCFDFSERVVVEDAKSLEIGDSVFQNIPGNALTIADGSGKIHDNSIENSQGSGIFAGVGNWEIFGNIIQKNSSYGIYGGYGANLNIHDNAISENDGYQVRLLKSREVYR